MEIDITEFFNSETPSDYSASMAEIGRNAASDTWQAANEAAEEYDFIKGDMEIREAIIEHFVSMGFSEGDAMQSWPNCQINAALIQEISSQMREFNSGFGESGETWDWQEYRRQSEEGSINGRLFGGELSVDGRVYIYIGN